MKLRIVQIGKERYEVQKLYTRARIGFFFPTRESKFWCNYFYHDTYGTIPLQDLNKARFDTIKEAERFVEDIMREPKIIKEYE